MKKKSSTQAFTLVEVLMVLTLMSVLTVTSILSLEGMSNDAAFDKTYGRLTQIKTALIGDLDTNKIGTREYFGYLGDIGQLPTQDQGLEALLSRPAGVAAWAINSTSRTGMGWRGPYLKGTTGVNWLKDAWGNDIVYSATAKTITSLGSDGAAGGVGTATDIQLSFTDESTTADVVGVLNRNSVVFNSEAEVSLYYPDGNGSLATRTDTVSVGDMGAFSFNDVPMGLRSIYVTFPSLSDVIGPVLLSIDKAKYQVPHNFMDSAPGEMPHTCADINNYSVKDDSVAVSTTTQRVYFELEVTQSMAISSIFVRSSNEKNFVKIRVGNTTKDCSGDLNCFRRQGNDPVAETTYNESKHFPEISLDSEWTIPIGANIGSFVEFNADVDEMSWVQLRLGCRLVTLTL